MARVDAAIAPTTAAVSAPRVTSLDIVRGAVMVLMAIDHVRVYSGVAAGGPTAGVFFTRWVTHFCAPVFVFLAGTAAFLQLRKTGDRAALARYLLVRGLLLVVLELTVIRAAWTFSADYSGLILAGVIWMLGWCMVLMAALIWLPVPVVGLTGLLLIVGQDMLPAVAAMTGDSTQWLWKFLYLGGDVQLGAGGPTITILYTIVPWVGVMALGYAFGPLVVLESTARRRVLLRIGLAATALFVVIGGIAVAGNASSDGPPVLFQLLNQRKYPASVPFLLMTLGPAIVLLALADRIGRTVGGFLATFGKVPLFYYLLHIPLIHVTALLVWFLRDGVVDAGRFSTAPFVQPMEQPWSLPLLYLVFAIDVALLYVACRWYAGVKANRPQPWMRYI